MNSSFRNAILWVVIVGLVASLAALRRAVSVDPAVAFAG